MIPLSPTENVEDNEVQINCKCGSKAVIGSRAQRDPKVFDLYCSCKDPKCGHTFVYVLSFSHTLSPSASEHKSMVLHSLLNMPEEDKKEILEQASLI